MRKIRRRRLVWLPYGYHLKPRYRHTGTQQPDKPATNTEIQSPQSIEQPVISNSEPHRSQPSDIPNSGQKADIKQTLAHFDEGCNPYQVFIQDLASHLTSMPKEVFTSNSVSPEKSRADTSTDNKQHDGKETRDSPALPDARSSATGPHLNQSTGIRSDMRTANRKLPSKGKPFSQDSARTLFYPAQVTTQQENPMRQLLFRLCEASDGRTFAFLTDQPDVEDFFDSGYKVAYKYRDGDNGQELLARWRSAYSVTSQEFAQLPDNDELPEGLQNAFDTMISSLIPGVDVFFCDYNLAIEADLPICNNIMDKYRSTDFVLFSCEELIGNDPNTQPYMVSYATPRYPDSGNTGSQHKIYCKTDAFAFCQAVHAIVIQREKDALTGGHIRTEVDTYIRERPVEESTAEQVINRFVEALPQYNSSIKALGAPSE